MIIVFHVSNYYFSAAAAGDSASDGA